MNSTEQIFKSEIHVHLEATITPDLCRKFAKRNNVNLSEDLFGTKYAYEWDDFYDFIKKYDLITSVIHTPDDYRELTYQYLKDCAASDTIYVEAMVSSTHAKKKGMTYHSFLDGVHEASLQAEKDFGIVSRFIMNGIRHLGPESVQDTAYEVLQNPHPCLVGFGLAGDELHFPPNLFVKTFDMLKEANFPITVHAGEWDGPENIRNAIKKIEIRLKFYEENYAIKDKQDLVAMCLIEYASKLEYFNNKDIDADLTKRLESINNILNDNI